MLSRASKVVRLLQATATSLWDPTRTEAVAAVGDITSEPLLHRLHHRMKQHPVGQRILRERPIVSEANFDLNAMRALPPTTFGRAYAQYLEENQFVPSKRDPVVYVQDDEMAYVLTRYRQNHDFWHVLAGLPASVLGELGLKWLEFSHMGLPVALGSGLLGPVQLNWRERRILFSRLVPWALSQRHVADLMCVYYEEHFGDDLATFRRRLGITVAPPLDI